jgi:hypothetical protein
MQIWSLFLAYHIVLYEHVAVGVKNFNVISAYIDILYIQWIQDVVRGTVGCGISHKNMYTGLHSFIHSFFHLFIA